MIMQVIPKHVYQVNSVIASLSIGVTWKQHCKIKHQFELLHLIVYCIIFEQCEIIIINMIYI